MSSKNLDNLVKTGQLKKEPKSIKEFEGYLEIEGQLLTDLSRSWPRSL